MRRPSRRCVPCLPATSQLGGSGVIENLGSNSCERPLNDIILESDNCRRTWCGGEEQNMTQYNGEGHLQAVLDDSMVEYDTSPTSDHRVALEFFRGAKLADTAVTAANAAHSTESAQSCSKVFLRKFAISCRCWRNPSHEARMGS